MHGPPLFGFVTDSKGISLTEKRAFTSQETGMFIPLTHLLNENRGTLYGDPSLFSMHVHQLTVLGA